MPAEELAEFLTSAGFHVVASPTSVDIFGYESTLLVARNWGVIQPGRLPVGPSPGFNFFKKQRAHAANN
ncbi:hypothetical protein AK812_SmicGene2865 [Symbiodinium microadriaticum]|uniref:Uncharacterized protein n=1 Tax=Symbiodinium microadriaticum TaxID=2951 RepID=A0A1Q9F0F4_SYMMI|nr:hypothetical protein AK812_SmicGene2865 [Symbiodinium microadriaticum]